MANVSSRVIELVETFDRNIETYKKQPYNEAQVRSEFIDPFFEALGWDVTNRRGYAPAYKDVIHEDAIKIGGATEAPDYCFRIGDTRKFFVEAKKPSIDIKGDPHPAYQLRRYAWSAKLPLSILTDFEEFAVYDCQSRPKQHDRASTARIMYLKYKEYVKRWSDIESIFSKDAILKGSFDKFAVATKGKRGTTTVDIELLAEIEKWRKMLARIIALRNRTLTKNEINFAVQRTIDRILFLRMCEDRGIEQYQQLQSIISGDRTYPRLCEIFEKADQKYNSGLFHFHDEPGRATPPDCLTPNITIDDKDLKYILHSLYYPLCPYEFSVLPPEILGNVYEQFLGSVITISGAHRADVVPKPEVKKAGGVYYTPAYIVDYIVKNTVGKLIEGKTPRQIVNIKILDPACGSGSFLLRAYTYLLNYHRDWYVENDPEKHTKKIYQGRGGQWYLTIAEKKRILLRNIFGIDIDSQAVEVTKLSLLLKVLEGEDSQTLENQYRLFHERALPDLGNNIKCGNSLIGPDFFEGKDPDSIDPEEYSKINPFDWEKEFPQTFKRQTSKRSGDAPQADGFDAVIGNPPYVSFGLRDVGRLSKAESAYYRSHLKNSAEYKVSMYAMFMQLGIDKLKIGGNFSFIVPDSFLLGRYSSKLRRYILDSCWIEQFLMIRDRVFATGTVGTSVIFAFQKKSPKSTNNHCLEAALCENTSPFMPPTWSRHRYPQSYFETLEHNRFRLFFSPLAMAYVQALEVHSVPLKSFARITTGVRSKSGQHNVIATSKQGPNWKKGIVSGSQVLPYRVNWEGHYLHIDGALLYSGGWDSSIVEQPKIMIRQTGDTIIAALDRDKHLYHLNNVHSLAPLEDDVSLPYICSLLNSRLMNRYYHLISLESGRTMAQTDIETLELLPIREPDVNTIQQIELLVSTIDNPKATNEIERILEDLYDLPEECSNYLRRENLYPDIKNGAPKEIPQ